jgi:hypothetical protein
MIRAFKCESCGILMYPKHSVCPSCNDRNIKRVEISDEGTLLTYTLLYALPEGFEEKPLPIGIAEFDGVRVTGQITRSDNLNIGMRVKAVYSKIREVNGKELFGYKFKPL